MNKINEVRFVIQNLKHEVRKINNTPDGEIVTVADLSIAMGIPSYSINTFNHKNHVPYKAILIFCKNNNIDPDDVFFKKRPLSCIRCATPLTDENKSISMDKRYSPPKIRTRGECKACRSDMQKVRSAKQYEKTKEKNQIKREKKKELEAIKKIELAKKREADFKQREINKAKREAEKIAKKKAKAKKAIKPVIVVPKLSKIEQIFKNQKEREFKSKQLTQDERLIREYRRKQNAS